LVAGVGSLAAPLSLAQVYKCTDTAGNLTFTDRPCDSTQSEEAVTIDYQPGDPEKAAQREKEIREHRAQRRLTEADNRRKEIEDLDRKITRMRDQNYDPAACKEYKRRMAAIERRDPLAGPASTEYFEAWSGANLHCGDGAPEYNPLPRGVR
jgi:hypothetical protein